MSAPSTKDRMLVPAGRGLWRAAAAQPTVQLVCFPHAGAAATSYADWTAWLPAGAELLAVQLPGRQDRIREPLPEDSGQVIAQVCDLLAGRLDAPGVVFFGHSCGAILAFEVARALAHAAARGPDQLVVSGQLPPSAPPREHLHTLPEPEFRAAVQALGGVDPELAADEYVMADLMPLVRADFGMWERHVPTSAAPVSCPITAFGGTQDPVAPPEGLSGWRAHTTGASALRLFPGGHFYLIDQLPTLVAHVLGTVEGPES